MINNKIIPAHIIRLYVWQILDEQTSMDPINGLTPILAVEDEPRVAESGKAYCIYGYAENEAIGQDQIKRGVFSLRVMAPTFGELTQILNTVGLAFESTDIAVEGLNRFSSSYQSLIGIRFTRAKTSYIEGGEAAESEGGPMDGVVNIGYEYINNLTTPVPSVLATAQGLWL